METPTQENASLLRADYEFLASAASHAIWGDDRYRRMRRKEFLIAVRRHLGQPLKGVEVKAEKIEVEEPKVETPEIDEAEDLLAKYGVSTVK